MIEVQDVFQHPFGFGSLTFGIQFYSFCITVDGLCPLSLSPELIALNIELFSGH